MKKKELLAPVGNYESLLQAVQNGCDAVYCSGKKFGARAFANNFTEEELVNAIKYCHLYNVKIYITVNTIIYEQELDECINYIRFLHQNNVDAVILQDLGLIKIVREKFPNLEIHASTQMHNHNTQQLKMLERIGVKRVVLARELSIKEINELKTNLELEVFIHGALCISYSGQCLFSSLLMNRSGNRGSCAGICRLPFLLFEDDKKIETNGKYLLSPKEFSSINDFKQIMESNIYSLKIEGRMKSPYYVGFITRLYRNLIDNYNEGKELNIQEDEMKKLKVLFNRGFTKGHLFNAKNEELMNIKTPNHQGIHLGTVLEIKKDKIKIKIDDVLNQEDGIRFFDDDKGLIVNFLYNEKGLLINKAKKGDIVYVDNKIGLKNKGEVLKTIDHSLEKELAILPERKVEINCAVIAKIGKKLSIAFSDGENKIAKSGSVIEKASTKPTTNEVIKEKISSLGNTPFMLKNIEIISDDNIFLSMSELKKIRREIIEELIEIRENKIPHEFIENKLIKKELEETSKDSELKINVLVRNKEQLETCLNENVDTIYVTNEKLYQEYKEHNNVYLRLERVKNKFPNYTNEKLLLGETGALYKYSKDNNVVSDYYFNVVNSYNFNFLERMNVKRITLSIEATLEDIKLISNNIKNKEKIEVYLYGRPEVMILKHCPLNMLVNKNNICTICSNNHKYYLKDRNQKLYPIISNAKENHLTHIFYYKNIDRIDEINEYQKMKIKNYRVELFDETKEQTRLIVRKIKSVKF